MEVSQTQPCCEGACGVPARDKDILGRQCGAGGRGHQARSFRLGTQGLATGRGLLSEQSSPGSPHVRWGGPSKGELRLDTACRKPWVAFSQSPTSAEGSGEGPRRWAPKWTKMSRTPGPGQEHGG